MLAPVVTRRYAEALLDAASESKAVAAVEADLAIVDASVGDPIIKAFLLNPTIEPREHRARFVAVLEPKLSSKLVKNVLALLVDRRRAEVIPALPAAFRRLALEARGEAEGTIEASRALSAAELRAIEDHVGREVGRKVHLTVSTDESLLGGFRVTVGSRRFDATVQGRLTALREKLLSAPLPV